MWLIVSISWQVCVMISVSVVFVSVMPTFIAGPGWVSVRWESVLMRRMDMTIKLQNQRWVWCSAVMGLVISHCFVDVGFGFEY